MINAVEDTGWTAEDEQAWQEHNEMATTPTMDFCPEADDHQHRTYMAGGPGGIDIEVCENCGYSG